MRFRRRLEEGKFALALEILPPQRPLPKVLLRRATLLGDAVQAVNVIQRPGRQSSLEASLHLQAAGIEPAWHLVTRGRSRAEVAADLRLAADGGIRQVLCILGDHTAQESSDPIAIRDAIALACEALGDGIVGATLINGSASSTRPSSPPAGTSTLGGVRSRWVRSRGSRVGRHAER